MPTGIPKSGKRQTRAPLSSQTQALLDHMAELEERLATLRQKDRARAGLLAYAKKHGLEASDLRDTAKILGARETGTEPVTSLNLAKSKKQAMGRKIKEARIEKGLTGTELGRKVGAKASSAVASWEGGMMPTVPKYRTGLIKHLDLPKDFFADLPTRKLNGAHP